MSDLAFPPVPAWKPKIDPQVEKIIERVHHYANHQYDFAVFKNGTCVILPEGLSDDEARAKALAVLDELLHSQFTINPQLMVDGNILIHYDLSTANLVLAEVAKAHRAEIAEHYLEALAPDEVIITPLGSNEFDEFGQAVLFGRCYFYLDAQAPEVIKICRKGSA